MYICQESSGRERNNILELLASPVKCCAKSNLSVALMSSMGNESMELTELLCVTKENLTMHAMCSHVFSL